MTEGPSRRLRPSRLACYARSEEAVADVNAARVVLGENRLVATSTDIEGWSELAVTMAPVAVMATVTVAVMTMAAMLATMFSTVPAAGGRRRNGCCGQGESGRWQRAT